MLPYYRSRLPVPSVVFAETRIRKMFVWIPVCAGMTNFLKIYWKLIIENYFFMKKIITFTDGGARGNPGHAGIGVIIKNEAGETLEAYGRYIGETTNNQAEYKALLSALERAKELGAEEVACHLDSELVTKQMNREYKVKDAELAKLFVKIWNLTQEFKKVTFQHVYREKNTEADAMVNEAIDKHLKN